MALATLLKSPMLWIRPLSSLFTGLLVLNIVLCVYGQVRRPEDITPGAERMATGAIHGRVILPNGAFADEAVKITISTLRGTLTTIYTETQGQFEFTGLQPGTYYLEFEANRQRYEPVTETVQVYRSTPTVITVTLRPVSRPALGSSAETISVAELKEKVPDNARKEFEKASLAGAKGQTDEAISHLRKAIAIFPSFIRARNDLGTYLLAQGRLDEAEEELRKAIALDADAFNPRLNLGIVLVHKQAFPEAHEQLRKALSVEPNSAPAHLYAGLSLAAMEKLDPAEVDFKEAYSLGGAKFGVALFHLGELYIARGDNVAALKSFEEYLSVIPDAKNAQQVKQLIAMLRR
jgi:tetratricopeptide (TPR) repeat protein